MQRCIFSEIEEDDLIAMNDKEEIEGFLGRYLDNNAAINKAISIINVQNNAKSANFGIDFAVI